MKAQKCVYILLVTTFLQLMITAQNVANKTNELSVKTSSMRQTYSIVTSQEELQASVISDAIVDFGCSIYLNSTIFVWNVSNLVIHGNGFILDGNSTVRIMTIKQSDVIIESLTISNGGHEFWILNNSSVTLYDSVITSNIGDYV